MLNKLSILIKGAGEMASGIAWRLHKAGFTNIVMLETDTPLAVRRRVSFCEAVYDGRITVDGVTSILATSDNEINNALQNKQIPVVVDPKWNTIVIRNPQIVIDAILAKKNLGTRREEAELVIGIGPGFKAGKDTDIVVETHRGVPIVGDFCIMVKRKKTQAFPGRSWDMIWNALSELRERDCSRVQYKLTIM